MTRQLQLAKRGAGFLVAMLLLSGCATSTPPPERFMLPGATATTLGAGDVERVLVVQPPRLAHYLDVDGIVLQLDDITLHAARQHLWAEPLGRQLERGLRARLAERLPGTRILRDDGGAGQRDAVRLRIEVDTFQGRHDGLAVAGGQWQLLDAQGQVLAMQPFQVSTELADDGYPALVRALGSSWDGVADDIASALRRLPR